MLEYIQRRKVVYFDVLIKALRDDGVVMTEKEIWNELQGLIETGEVIEKPGRSGSLSYQVPGVEIVKSEEGSIAQDAKKLLPALKKSSLAKGTFCASNVWAVLGKDLKLGTSGRVKYLLAHLEGEGEIVLDRVKNSPGGLSKKYRLADVEPTELYSTEPKKKLKKVVKKPVKLGPWETLLKADDFIYPWMLEEYPTVGINWITAKAKLANDFKMSPEAIEELKEDWLASGKLIKGEGKLNGWHINRGWK